MMRKSVNHKFFDSTFPRSERLPRVFDVEFRERQVGTGAKVSIYIGNRMIGDAITDNSFQNDSYRFHDVFHFSYVAALGWSPCVRNMLRRKRKSNPRVDEVEDGARAIIAEEAISLLVFSHARHANLFESQGELDTALLTTIRRLVENFEVRERSLEDWKRAIEMGYEVFRQLVANRSGLVHVDMNKRELRYIENS